MANSGVLKSNSQAISGNWLGELEFSWTSESVGAGTTKVFWELWAKGRENKAGSEGLWSTYNVLLDGDSVASLNNSKQLYDNRQIATGEFTKNHDAQGKASFTVQIKMSKKYNTFTEQTYEATFELDTNYPYSETEPPSANSITITPSIQKPGGTITISWEEGKEGTANRIKYYRIQTYIGNTLASTTTTEPWSNQRSCTVRLPDNAARAEAITARVQTVGEGPVAYDGDYSDPGGTSNVNSLPGAPHVSGTLNTTVPSGGGRPEIHLTAGDDSDEQSCSIWYSVGADGTKKEVRNNVFNEETTQETTYYFWTYDGLEFSEDSIHYEVELNTPPTTILGVTYAGDGVGATLSFDKGEGGQSTNTKYFYGFTYNNIDYKVGETNSQSATIEDIRQKLYMALGEPLTDKTKYFYQYWAYRNDGIEDSQKSRSGQVSFYIPELILKNEKGKQTYFSNAVTVSQGEIPEGEKTGSYNFTYFGGTLLHQLSDLPYETKLDVLEVNGEFDVKLSNPLTKISKGTLAPPVNTPSPFLSMPFAIYTNSAGLGINLSTAGLVDSKYGISQVAGNSPKLKLKIGKYSEDLIPIGSSAESIIVYNINASDLYNLIEVKGSNKVEVELEIQNDFYNTSKNNKDLYSVSFDLDLDWTAAPKISFASLFTKPSDYMTLSTLPYLKEGVPIHCDCTVYAFDTPRYEFDVYNYENSGKWEEWASGEFNGETATTATTTQGFTVNPITYTFSKKELLEGIGQVFQDCEVDFRLRLFTDGNKSSEIVFYKSKTENKTEHFLIKKHYAPKAYFVQPTYINSKLSAKLQLESNDWGVGEKASCGFSYGVVIQEDEDNPRSGFRYDSESESKEYYKDNFKFEINDDPKDFLHIAPYITTKSWIEVNEVRYFETIYNTSKPYSYVVVYNITPTVAYRKNHLGINTLSPSDHDNSIIYIGEYGVRNTIYFASSDGSIERSLNISNGTMSGFVLNGGEWSKSSGGTIIPPVDIGGGSIPTTVYLEDLESRGAPPVFIIAGSANDYIS